MPITPLVCTAGTKFNSSVSLPSDGVCDFTFYDSMHENGRNTLLGPYDENFEHFVTFAGSHSRTQYGVGLNYGTVSDIAKIFTGNSGTTVIENLEKRNTFHYGFINTATWATTYDLKNILRVLKVVSTLTADRGTGRPRSYTAFAASLQMAGTIEEVATIFKEMYTPSLIISYGHLFAQDQLWPDCNILPPTFLIEPGSPSYKYNLESAVIDLESLRNQGVTSTWAVSVASFGRWYQLVSSAPGDALNNVVNGKAYTRFGTCNVTANTQQLASIAEACRKTLLRNCKYSESLQCEFCHDTTTKRMLMYDNAKALRRKLCQLKKQHLTLKYGIAVYSLEFADWSNACRRHEAFNELAAVRAVVDYLPRFGAASNVTACVAATAG
ncbi:uncharacterized protein LOC119430975 [Dermacentor silvarum]|uniref:uncharacterized protein LOC119430975 n=1 Tax=Dermacentor silvarum TaxID=543639 RepID=UPI001896ABB5|nr:uncharacterized protein LOC119430975 [Dermacentor silvarum]